MVKGFAIDIHFWISLIGSECDKGLGNRDHLVEKLVRNTSLKTDEANEILDEMVKQGKLVPNADDNSKWDCTIPLC